MFYDKINKDLGKIFDVLRVLWIVIKLRENYFVDLIMFVFCDFLYRVVGFLFDREYLTNNKYLR